MQFEMTVIGDAARIAAMTVDAPDRADAVRQAEKLGYGVLKVRAKSGFAGWTAGRRTSFPLTLFSQELLALLDAGLSLVESIETLAEKETRADTRRVLAGVIARLREGQPFSGALQGEPGLFPDLYVATVRAAERTGDLGEAIGRFVAYQNQLDFVRKKLVSASIYPCLLLVIGGLVTLFLLGYVVPKFSRIYADIGRDLPLMSQLLLQFGTLIEAHGIAIVLGLAAAAAGAGFWVSRPRTLARLQQQLWAVPVAGERIRIYHLARFYRTLGMLLRGGIPIVTALDMASGLLPQLLIARLAAARRSISEGQPISLSMESHGLTSAVASRMLRVGERTGKMGEMMERIAAFYDEEMARWAEWFVKLFEPLLMTVIGAVIGLIVVLMYAPIFELAGSIQ